MDCENSQMKLTYITLNGRIPSTSANSVGVMKMCGELSKMGHSVTLLVPDCRTSALKSHAFFSRELEYYAVASPFVIKRFFNPYGYFERIPILYSFFLFLYSVYIKKSELILTRNFEVALWGGLFNFPVIFENHNYSKIANHFLLKVWVRWMNDDRKPVLTVVTTNAGKSSFINLGVRESQMLVVPNAAEVGLYVHHSNKLELRKELGLPEDKKIAAFSGSFHPGKGLEYVLECATLLEDVLFLIIGGTGSEVEQLSQLAKEQGRQNLVFIGHVAQSELPRYLCSADILLLPNSSNPAVHSKDYTSPMKMFDYLATGSPIVATDFPVFRDVLQDGKNAILVKPDSGRALAEGIWKLIQDQHLASYIGLQARQDSSMYSWENRAKKIISWAVGKFNK